MRIGSGIRWFLVCAALGVGLPAVVSCKDDKKESKDDEKSEKKSKKKSADDDSEDKADKKSKKKKGDDDGDEKPKAKEAGPYANGAILKFVPKSCESFGYLNVGALLKNEAITANANALQDKLSEALNSDAKSKKVGKALKELKKNGIDLMKDVKELGVCGSEKFDRDGVILFGGSLGKDPLGAISKTVAAMGEDEPKAEDKDGVSFLTVGKKDATLALVGGNVLAAGPNQGAILALAKEPAGGSTWSIDSGRILAFKVANPRDADVAGTITAKGEDLDFVVDMTFPEGSDAAKGVEKNPAAFKAEMKKQIDKVSAKLEKSPLKKLADDVKGIKLNVDGRKVSFTMTIPAAHVGEILKAAADADPSELGKAFK